MRRFRFKKKNDLKHTIALVSTVTLLVLIVLTGALTVYSSHIREQEREQKPRRVPVERPVIKTALLTKNNNSRPGIALKSVKHVVIHYTANPGTDAMANRDYFESRKNMEVSYANKVSSHFVIGLDGTIVQCIPLDEIAYASNKRNIDSISIECCHPNKSGKFTDRTRVALIQLTAWLCDTYGVKTSDILRHYDVTGKKCPKYYVANPEKWSVLKRDIQKELDGYQK